MVNKKILLQFLVSSNLDLSRNRREKFYQEFFWWILFFWVERDPLFNPLDLSPKHCGDEKTNMVTGSFCSITK